MTEEKEIPEYILEYFERHHICETRENEYGELQMYHRCNTEEEIRYFMKYHPKLLKELLTQNILENR